MPTDRDRLLLKILLGDIRDPEDHGQRPYDVKQILEDINKIDVITIDDIPEQLKKSLLNDLREDLRLPEIEENFKEQLDQYVRSYIEKMNAYEEWNDFTIKVKNELAEKWILSYTENDFMKVFREKIASVLRLKIIEMEQKFKETLKGLIENPEQKKVLEQPKEEKEKKEDTLGGLSSLFG